MGLMLGAGMFTVAAVLVLLSIPIVKTLVEQKKLLDTPEETRKVHRGEIPTLGGVAIFLGFFITISFSGIVSSLSWYPIFSGILVLLLFTGLKDDILGIDAKKKLVIQVAAATGITFIGGVYISNFGGLFGFGSIPTWAAIPFTIFVLIVLTNAYNLIDGIDGLAAGIGLIISLSFTIWFFYSGFPVHALLSLTLAGALVGFLYYNFAPASIFMGDTGSLVVGFSISIFAIAAIRIGTTNPDAVLHGNVPVLVMAILSVPLYDTLRVFLIRGLQGRSPFEPGNDHIHHEILKLGFGHRVTSAVLYGLNLLVIGFVLLFSSLPSTWLFLATALFVMLIFPNFGVKRMVMNKFYGMKLQRVVNRIDYGQHEINRKIDRAERAEREMLAQQEY